MKRLSVFPAMACLIAAVFCAMLPAARAQETKAGSGRPLTGTQWDLLEVQGKQVPQNGLEPYFILKARDRYQEGSSGTLADATDRCGNQLTGTYAATREQLRVRVFSSTLVACKVMGGDTPMRDLSAILGGTHRFRILGNRLEIFDENGEVQARFAAGEAD